MWLDARARINTTHAELAHSARCLMCLQWTWTSWEPATCQANYGFLSAEVFLSLDPFIHWSCLWHGHRCQWSYYCSMQPTLYTSAEHCTCTSAWCEATLEDRRIQAKFGAKRRSWLVCFAALYACIGSILLILHSVCWDLHHADL